MGGGGSIQKKIKYSTVESEFFGLSLSAAEQITPGEFSIGNTVMWILSFPFIIYECKCYKLAAVKTSVLHLYL